MESDDDVKIKVEPDNQEKSTNEESVTDVCVRDVMAKKVEGEDVSNKEQDVSYGTVCDETAEQVDNDKVQDVSDVTAKKVDDVKVQDVSDVTAHDLTVETVDGENKEKVNNDTGVLCKDAMKVSQVTEEIVNDELEDGGKGSNVKDDEETEKMT